MPPAGGSSGTTQIDDPGSLKKAGQGANELAGGVKVAGASAEESTRAAAGSLKGGSWSGSLGTALDQALSTWQSQTTALVNRCLALNEKCVATADNYARTETANEQTLAAVRPAEPSPFG